MELLYAYIEKFKNIERQEFNFSPRCNIHYDPDANSLSIEASPYYIPNLFGPGISNVTAIIGKNGSGKSNLLEFLVEHIVGAKHSWESNAILVFLKGENEIAYKTNLGELTVNIKDQVKVTQIEAKQEAGLQTAEGSCLYYSYLYDDELRPFQYENHEWISDLSTNNRVTFREAHRARFKSEEIRNQLTYRALEMRTLVRFLAGIRTDILDIRLPDLIQVSISVPFTVEMVKNAFRFGNALSNDLSENLDFIANHLINTTTYSHFRAGLFFGILFDQVARFMKDRFTIYIADLVEYLKEHDQIKDDILFAIPLKNNYQEQVRKVLECIADLKPFEYDENSFRVPVAEGQKVIRFINKLQLVNIQTPDPFQYDVLFSGAIKPGGLSGGERSFLGLLSRFYLTAETILPGSYFVFLDEADIGFHPQWQKHLLKYLCEYLPIILHVFGRSPVQLFVTAHSPFIASDLPKENILFLNKDSEGKCQIDPGVRHEQTFAANIHTLFSDSFFLDDGLIGDLAKQRIEELIKAIQEFPETSEIPWLRGDERNRKQLIRALIGKVGEPIVQEKLYDLYDELIGETLEEKKARLQNELDEVNRQIENQDE